VTQNEGLDGGCRRVAWVARPSDLRKLLGEYEELIRDEYPILTLALEKWVGREWSTANLEAAWTSIDLEWKERSRGSRRVFVADLTDSERHEFWCLVTAAAEAEADEPSYYRRQISWARDTGRSSEEFLSVAAGWDLRRLIQRCFRVDLTAEARQMYETLLQRLNPDTLISFNYDTLLESASPLRNGGIWGR
jgi:hypothetical protein